MTTTTDRPTTTDRRLKASAETIEAVRAAIAPLDTAETRAAYLAGDFPRADRVKDLDKRYRWDLYWAARAYDIGDVDDMNDTHRDSMLRAIVPPLA